MPRGASRRWSGRMRGGERQGVRVDDAPRGVAVLGEGIGWRGPRWCPGAVEREK